jgi:hypothetical protein
MISTSYSGKDVWLVSSAPDWKRGVDATFEMLTFRESTVTQIENRRGVSERLRTSMSYKAKVNLAESTAMRSYFQQMDDRPVLCPFWPAMELASDWGWASIGGALRVWFEPDWSAFELGTGVAPAGFTPSAKCLTAPVMYGRFDKVPSLEPLNALGTGEVDLDLTDEGPFTHALQARNVTLALGTQVGGQDVPKLGITLNWVRPAQSGEVFIERDTIGLGREKVISYADQTARRTQDVAVCGFDSAEVAQLTKLFEYARGSAKAWWCPGAHGAGNLYGRFKTDKLAVRWHTPAIGQKEVAEAKLSFVELPDERALPAGEARGVTIGELPQPWWGFVVHNGNAVWRFTSHENNINAGVLGLFTSAPVDHGDITKEINLARHDCKFSAGYFTGSPFELLRKQADTRLTVEIYEGTLASPAAAQLIFTGDIVKPSFNGSKMDATISGTLSLFDTKGPLALCSPRCWVPLYSPLCGVSRVDKTHLSTLKSVEADGTLMFGDAAGGNYPEMEGDFFRFGYAEKALGDGTVERYRVAANNALAAGTGYLAVKIVGTLESTHTLPESGWGLVPGCDKSFGRCKILGGKFRGFPRFPKTNPALQPVKQNTSAGGKK